jgi:hypothetical protein
MSLQLGSEEIKIGVLFGHFDPILEKNWHFAKKMLHVPFGLQTNSMQTPCLNLIDS